MEATSTCRYAGWISHGIGGDEERGETPEWCCFVEVEGDVHGAGDVVLVKVVIVRRLGEMYVD
jgi:hypothetical protein